MSECGGDALQVDSDRSSNPVRKKAILALALVAVAGLLAYGPAMGGAFIWDDDAHVGINAHLGGLRGLAAIWTDPSATQQYYPLTQTVFWLEYQLWGPAPLGYHVVNILLHLGVAYTLWVALKRLEAPGALAVAAIFALHPVNVESVAWISELKNTLSGLFYLLALLQLLSFCEVHEPARWRHFTWGCVFFACALFSKTVTATLPAVVILLLWWKRPRLSWLDIRRDVLPLLALCTVGAGMGLLTAWLEKAHVGASGAEFSLSLVERLLVAGRAVWFYIGKVFWPWPLTFIYPRWQLDPSIWWQRLLPIALVLAILLLLLLRRRIGKAPLVAVLFFIGTLVPALGFFNVFPMRYSFVADHFQYLASIGIIALAVGTAQHLAARWGSAGDKAGAIVLVAVLAALGTVTWRQAHIYQDPDTLWNDTLAKNPQCWLAYEHLGIARATHGDVAGGIEYFRRSLAIWPQHPEGHYSLARALRLEPKPNVGEAIKEYREALRLSPNYYKASAELAWILATSPDARYRNGPEAVPLAQRACTQTHNADVFSLSALAVAYAEDGKFDQAVQTAQQAASLASSQNDLERESALNTLADSFRRRVPYRDQPSRQ